MVTLNELTAIEAYLCGIAQARDGHAEERLARLKDAGVYGAYADALRGYIDLLEHAIDGREALKRATFLVWYSQSEPPELTGLGGWPQHLDRRVVLALDQSAACDRVDAELAAMMAFHNSVSNYPFSMVGPLSSLAQLLAQTDDGMWEGPGVIEVPADPLGRGQMSHYWSGILG